MKTAKLGFMALLAASLLGAGPAVGQDKPYKEGTVWSVSLIKVKPGMLDVYLRDLGSARKKLMEEAKKQGLIVSEKMFIGSASNREDWDVMFMVEYKNWAALDGLSGIDGDVGEGDRRVPQRFHRPKLTGRGREPASRASQPATAG